MSDASSRPPEYRRCPPQASPRAVVFDMDGLMFNTEEVYTLVGAELLARRGQVFTTQLKDAIMGLPPRPCFEMMIERLGLGERWEAMAAESNEIFLALLQHNLALMPGLEELLAALEAAGIPKAIATSTSPRLVDACLAPFDLRRRFQFVLTCEDITQGKPNPEIYLKAAARLGVQPTEMLVLEDSHYGCRAASAAGALTVAVPGPHSQSHDFSMASMVIDTLRDPRLYAVLGLPKKA